MTSPETELDDAQTPDEASEDKEEKQEMTLDVKVDSPSACQRHVTVSISRDDIERYYDEAFTELMPKASVPGFRPGRAPRKLVESRFREDVADQVKGSLLMDSMTQVTEQNDFSAISEPDFDFEAIEIPKEGPMTFEFDLEVRPEFEMPQWKGLRLERPVREITKEHVTARLRELLARFGMLEPHDGPVEADDYVVVDLTCRHGGEVISRAEEQTIRVRPNLSFRDGNLAGFDQLIIGARAGDVREAQVTVGEEAPNEDLCGQEVDLTLKVLEVKRLSLPELDDAFLSRLGNFDSEGDLLDFVKQDLERQLAYHQQRRVRQQITSLLTESANWDLPPDLLKRQAQRELDRATMELRASGFSEEQIRTHANVLRQNSRVATATALKEHFILERIAEEEELEVTEGDYEMEIRLIASQLGESPRSVRARFEKRSQMDALRNQIVERKAIRLITEAAEFTDVEMEQEGNETAAIDFALSGESESEIPDAKHGESRELPEPLDHT